jgi:hypothetical protein
VDFQSVLPLVCLVASFPNDGAASESEPLIGRWALTLPSGEAGWLSVQMQQGQPHVRFETAWYQHYLGLPPSRETR